MAHYGQLCAKPTTFWGSSKEIIASMVRMPCFDGLLLKSYLHGGTQLGQDQGPLTKEQKSKLSLQTSRDTLNASCDFLLATMANF